MELLTATQRFLNTDDIQLTIIKTEALVNKLNHVQLYNKGNQFSLTAVVLHFKQILIKPKKRLN